MLVSNQKATYEKTKLSFKEGILSVKFKENTVIDADDMIYIYCYGMERSGNKPYGILFDSSSVHELTEDAVTYIGNTAHLSNIIAIAYISKTKISRLRLSLLMIFERPVLRPRLFNDENVAYLWLKKKVADFYSEEA